MDGQRFDQFTRLIGAKTPRRRVLRLFAVAAGGAAVRLGQRTGVGAQGACAAEGELCGGLDPECCEGLICDVDNSERCVTAQTCVEQGDVCETDADCCEGLFCPQDQLDCEPIPVACAAEGETCEDDAACCAGICCAGACRAIECCIDEKDPNARCPKGTSCFEGICEGVAEKCSDDGDCAWDACCCADGSCSGDCCEAQTDDGSTGGSTVLPSTGTGQGDDASTPWLGVAALGGAAAILAAKKLRAGTDPSSTSTA